MQCDIQIESEQIITFSPTTKLYHAATTYTFSI